MNQTRRRCPLIDKRSRISPPALRVPAWRRDRALIEEVRLAPDSLVEEGGFETSVPRHGEVRAALHYSISGGVCGTGSGAAFDRAFPCSAGRYDRAYPFGGDGHPSTDKLVGASGVQRELRGQIIVRHIWATGELSNPRPSFGCLKCRPTMSSKSSMSTTMCGSKA